MEHFLHDDVGGKWNVCGMEKTTKTLNKLKVIFRTYI